MQAEGTEIVSRRLWDREKSIVLERKGLGMNAGSALAVVGN